MKRNGMIILKVFALKNYGSIRAQNRTPASHKYAMKAKLSAQGKWAKRIPTEQRLYDLDTGEIHDITIYEPSKGKSSLNTNM